MKLNNIRTPLLPVIMLLLPSLALTPKIAVAAEPHPVLVELFTSEGCSSCPPADALLRQINGKQTDTGQLIVGISEHVTYWNNLGWKDPYSASTYTDRQNAYGERFKLDSVYTPQMIVNGEREVLGSDRNAVLRAIRESDHPTQLTLHITSATISGDSVVATYSVETGTAPKNTELFAILADDTASSNVLRGENSGHTLSHVAVARSLTRIGSIPSAKENTIHLPLGKKATPTSLHLILFAQTPHQGPILSVDTAPIK